MNTIIKSKNGLSVNVKKLQNNSFQLMETGEIFTDQQKAILAAFKHLKKLKVGNTSLPQRKLLKQAKNSLKTSNLNPFNKDLFSTDWKEVFEYGIL